jgi:predicted nucleic acid-binding protein
MAYLLDADVFIRAKNDHYGFDICPGFWDWLIREAGARNVLSIEEIQLQLLAGTDELASWVKDDGRELFVPLGSDLAPVFAQISAWVVNRGFRRHAIDSFFDDPDYYLIAHALAGNHTVVTHERSEPVRRGQVKIPDVCAGLGVDCIDPFGMLRTAGARFELR